MKEKKDLLSRRQTLHLLGVAGATTLAGWGEPKALALWPTNNIATAGLPVAQTGQAGPTAAEVMSRALFTPMPVETYDISQVGCVAKPALTEGPYFVDERLNRSDIRTDSVTGVAKPGAPFKIRINVSRISNSTCTPLAGALVDIWHCDAAGTYSDVQDMGFNTRGQKYLRGYQVTDGNGAVEFTTIYPGWYSGRAVHIHFKIRLFNGTTKTYEFTSQWFFNDSFTDQVYQQAPYNAKGTRNTRNSNDGIYNGGGSQLLLDVASDGAGGYTANFTIGLNGVPATTTTTAATAVSAASYGAGSLATEGIAALFGSGLAASTSAASTQPLPTTLNGVQVQVRDAAGTTRNAPLFFVSSGQINFQVPAGTVAGNATVSVMRDGGAVAQGTIAVDNVAPGLFTANGNGQGAPAALLLRVKANNAQSYESLVQFDSAQNRFVPAPIDFGEATDRLFLVAYGTGLRYRSTLSSVIANIGGTNADVLFAGAQDGFAGLDQLNLALPRTLAGRGNVDLNLSVDGRAANTVVLNFK